MYPKKQKQQQNLNKQFVRADFHLLNTIFYFSPKGVAALFEGQLISLYQRQKQDIKLKPHLTKATLPIYLTQGTVTSRGEETS